MRGDTRRQLERVATSSLPQNPVPDTQIIDDLQLVLAHPAGGGDQHETEWIQAWISCKLLKRMVAAERLERST